MRCQKVLKHRHHRSFVCIGGEPVQPGTGVAQVVVGYEVFGVCCHGAILLGETYTGLTGEKEKERRLPRNVSGVITRSYLPSLIEAAIIFFHIAFVLSTTGPRWS